MRTFRVYFINGNQRLFESENIVCVINHLVYKLSYHASAIVKIEEVKNEV